MSVLTVIVWVMLELVCVAYAQDATRSNNAPAPALVLLGNLVGGSVDARVTFADGTGVGPPFVAQLYGARAGAPLSELEPLFPTTVFLSSSPAVLGYTVPIGVAVPGLLAGQQATVIMRVYNGSSWETSKCRGESNPVNAWLSSPEVQLPPGNLLGLKPFHVYCQANVKPGLVGDHAQLTWAATNQQPYTVEAASSLSVTNWVPLLTITSTNGLAVFRDPISTTNSAPRFYRVRSP